MFKIFKLFYEKKHHLTLLIFGMLSLNLASCKKSENSDFVDQTVQSSLIKKFPKLTNLNEEETKHLKQLLSGDKHDYEAAIRYANILAEKTKDRPIQQSNISKKSNTSTDSDALDLTETSAEENLTLWESPNIWNTYSGQTWEDMTGYPQHMVPGFRHVHTVSLNIGNRGTLMTAQVPIRYNLSWDRYTEEPLYQLKQYNNDKPKLYVSGAVGQLTVEFENQSSMSINGNDGDYIINADVKVRENRTLVITSDGSRSISLNVGDIVIGANYSNGYAVQQTQNIQGYFDYNAVIWFFGRNIGFRLPSRIEYDEIRFNMNHLDPPVIGSQDRFSFTGIDRNN